MNKQAQVFARQVQLDLLAIPDEDLFQTVHLWVNGESAGASADVLAETRFALGYRLIRGETGTTSRDPLGENTLEAEEQWLAPSLPELRKLLTDMDVKFFVQYVLPLAFQSLHALHPEWDEGATFNAHLANHLRLIGKKQRRVIREPGDKEVVQ
jgi:hypothetical protein